MHVGNSVKDNKLPSLQTLCNTFYVLMEIHIYKLNMKMNRYIPFLTKEANGTYPAKTFHIKVKLYL